MVGPEEWLTPFIEAWSDWKGEAAGWEVHLVPDPGLPEPQGAYFEARPDFESGQCLLEAPGFAGTVDSEGREARLRAHPTAQPGDISYFIRTAFALEAFDEGSLLFHAAGVIHRDEGYVLFGRSGSGKTTAARLSKGKPVLNDDLLLLARGDDGWRVWATPFGRRRHAEVTSAPLRALLHLIQAPEDRVDPLPRSEALAALVANSPVVNADVERALALLSWWDVTLGEVPAYRLYFVKDNTFWEVVDGHLG
jgi:hypothetical protein